MMAILLNSSQDSPVLPIDERGDEDRSTPKSVGPDSDGAGSGPDDPPAQEDSAEGALSAHPYCPGGKQILGRNHLIFAGNVESEGVQVVEGGEMAVVSVCGAYSFNEDSALIGQRTTALGTRIGYLGVFDQAGGQGKLSTIGEASRIAAEELIKAAERTVSAPQTEGLSVLREAALEANREIVARNQTCATDAVTTFVAAIIQTGEVCVVNSGDSRALLVSATGEIKARTRLHNLGAELYQPGRSIGFIANYLRHALGVESEVVADGYSWPTVRGDWLILFTDGLGDANQLAQEFHPEAFEEFHAEVTARQIAEIVAKADSPREAATALLRYARLMVQHGFGKGDNISLAIARITE